MYIYMFIYVKKVYIYMYNIYKNIYIYIHSHIYSCKFAIVPFVTSHPHLCHVSLLTCFSPPSPKTKPPWCFRVAVLVVALDSDCLMVIQQ